MADTLPRHPPLMKCALVDAAFNKKGWIYEPKFDGVRVICIFDGDDWELLSRNNKPQNFQFPEIAAGLKRAIHKPAVVDGEIVCLDEAGKSSFRLLQQRFHLTSEALVQSRMAKFPAHLYLFDMLYFDTHDIRSLPLSDRKRALKQAVKWKDPIRMTPITLDRGTEMFEEACDRGEEGIIAKRADSRYSGDRGGAWLKIKCSGRQEFVIAGYTDPQGARLGFGALLVGYFDDDGKLRFAGKVGTGFNSQMLLDLHKRLKAIQIPKNPFLHGAGREARAHFVEPKLVAEIAYAEWTQNDMLRQPRFQGLREDKKASAVRREKAKHISAAPATADENDSSSDGDTMPTSRRSKRRGSKPAPARTAKASAKPQVDDTQRVHFTHLDKVMFPGIDLTKGDVLEYYAHIAPRLLPHLKDRPITIERLPDGLNGPRFWQKNIPSYYPSWIPRVELPTVQGKKVQYALINDLEALLYFVNQGTITFHVYLSRVKTLEHPDYVLFDLDPSESTFANVITIAKKIHTILDAAKIKSYPKTSGKSGLHVLAPWTQKGGFDEARDWAINIANEVVRALPKIATTERSLNARGSSVYVDVMQNAMGKHVVPAYVLRAVPEATASTPLEWREVTARLDPKKFDMKTVLKRAKSKDPMSMLL